MRCAALRLRRHAASSKPKRQATNASEPISHRPAMMPYVYLSVMGVSKRCNKQQLRTVVGSHAENRRIGKTQATMNPLDPTYQSTID